MASVDNQEASLLKYEVWKDQSFFKWRKRDAHVPLRCHDTIEGVRSICLMCYVFVASISIGYYCN